MTTLPDPSPAWTAADLRGWRARLRWTQARAADAVVYHLEAYKKLEAGTRPIGPRVRRLCLLTEREHVRTLYSTSGPPGARQVHATADNVLARIDGLRRDGRLVRRDGTPRTRYVSLFSGIEGATAALERIGSDAVPLAFAETDPAASAVLRHRWPDVPRVGDVTGFDWPALRGQVDLVCGGSPCQAFSIAGRRLGIADPRGNLALHFLRAVAAMQPEYFLYENVPGLLSANDGGDFAAFLEAVEDCGYACAWRVLDARHFGLPQRRRRVWVVGQRGGNGDRPVEILALGKGETGRARAGRAAWQAAAGRAEGGTGGLTPEEDVDWSEAAAWLSARRPAAAAVLGAPEVRTDRTLVAADLRHCTVGAQTMTLQTGPLHGWSLHTTPCLVSAGPDGGAEIRRFSPAECLRLQGFDDAWLAGAKLGGKPLTDSDCYRLAGNAWPVPVAAWILERLLAEIGW